MKSPECSSDYDSTDAPSGADACDTSTADEDHVKARGKFHGGETAHIGLSDESPGSDSGVSLHCMSDT